MPINGIRISHNFKLLLCALTLLTQSCGDGSISGTPANTLLLNKLGDGKAVLSWNGNLGDEFVSFLVFSLSDSGDSLITTLTSQEYTVTGLSNGRRYNFQVRTKKSDDTAEDRTNNIVVYPRPEGTGAILWEYLAPNQASAFNFSSGKTVSMRNENKRAVDIYLGTGAFSGSDEKPNKPISLKSPHYVYDPLNTWSDRVTEISRYDGAFDDLKPVVQAGNYAVETAVAGGVYHLKLKDADGDGQFHYAKLQITAVQIDGGFGKIQFNWAYQLQPAANEGDQF